MCTKEPPPLPASGGLVSRYPRLFGQLAYQLQRAGSGDELEQMWRWLEAHPAGLLGEQLAYVAAMAVGAPLVFGDRPKVETYDCLSFPQPSPPTPHVNRKRTRIVVVFSTTITITPHSHMFPPLVQMHPLPMHWPPSLMPPNVDACSPLPYCEFLVALGPEPARSLVFTTLKTMYCPISIPECMWKKQLGRGVHLWT